MLKRVGSYADEVNCAFCNPEKNRYPMKTVIKAFLVAGTADIVLALLKYYLESGNNPVRVLYFIASAVFGDEAFDGGTIMAASGLLFHYLIAFIWTILFFKWYPWLPGIKKNKWLTGLLYGIFIWLVMNLVVVPLSRTPPVPFDPQQMIYGLLILTVAVGIPLSFMIDQHYSKKDEA